MLQISEDLLLTHQQLKPVSTANAQNTQASAIYRMTFDRTLSALGSGGPLPYPRNFQICLIERACAAAKMRNGVAAPPPQGWGGPPGPASTPCVAAHMASTLTKQYLANGAVGCPVVQPMVPPPAANCAPTAGAVVPGGSSSSGTPPDFTVAQAHSPMFKKIIAASVGAAVTSALSKLKTPSPKVAPCIVPVQPCFQRAVLSVCIVSRLHMCACMHISCHASTRVLFFT